MIDIMINTGFDGSRTIGILIRFACEIFGIKVTVKWSLVYRRGHRRINGKSFFRICISVILNIHG